MTNPNSGNLSYTEKNFRSKNAHFTGPADVLDVQVRTEPHAEQRPEEDTTNYIGSNNSRSRYAHSDPAQILVDRAKDWDEVAKDDADAVDLFVKNLLDDYYGAVVLAKRHSVNAYNASSDLSAVRAQQSLPEETEPSTEVEKPWWKKFVDSLR